MEEDGEIQRQARSSTRTSILTHGVEMKKILKKGESIVLDLDCIAEVKKTVSKVAKNEFGYHTHIWKMEITDVIEWDPDDIVIIAKFTGFNTKKEDEIIIDVCLENPRETYKIKWANVSHKPIEL